VAGAEELLPPAFLARLASLLAATKRRLALSLAADSVERLVGAADEVERVADDLRLRQLLAHGLPVGVVGIDRDRRDRLTLGNGERAQIALDDAPVRVGCASSAGRVHAPPHALWGAKTRCAVREISDLRAGR
jgi:hypothetical protein